MTRKWDDPDLVKEVIRRNAIRAEHRKLAARDNQYAIAKDMKVPQSVICKLVQGRRTTQLSPEQQRVALQRYAISRDHTALAREHGSHRICVELGICTATRIRILKAFTEQPQSEPKPRRKMVDPISQFLLRRTA